MSYKPVQGFFFAISIGADKTDGSFQEVSGIGMERITEEINDGGENNFNYVVPSKVKFNNLVLKRGFMIAGSPLAAWCMQTVQSALEGPIQVQDITVQLLHPTTGKAISAWKFYNAYPVKWEISGFNSMSSDIIIENIEIAYTYFYMQNGNTQNLKRNYAQALSQRSAELNQNRQIENKVQAMGARSGVVYELQRQSKEQLLLAQKLPGIANKYAAQFNAIKDPKDADAATKAENNRRRAEVRKKMAEEQAAVRKDIARIKMRIAKLKG